MTIPGRMFNGVKFFRSKITYTSKKAADKVAKAWREDGFNARVARSTEKIRGKYQYHIYTRKR